MFYVQIFRTNVVLAAFSSCMYIVKAAEMTFVQKFVRKNVDEIDTRCSGTFLLDMSELKILLRCIDGILSI